LMAWSVAVRSMNAPSVDGHSDAPAAREVEQIVDHFLALFGPTRSRNSRDLYVRRRHEISHRPISGPFAGTGGGFSHYKFSKQLDRSVPIEGESQAFQTRRHLATFRIRSSGRCGQPPGRGASIPLAMSQQMPRANLRPTSLRYRTRFCKRAPG
jgi:hypothetical protein